MIGGNILFKVFPLFLYVSNRMNRIAFFRYLGGMLGSLLLLVACGPKRNSVVLPADFKGPKALERIYGVRITEHDNIYLYNEGARWIGTPHRAGGLTKRGVDCSGLVTAIYREVYGKQLSRSSADMWKQDCRKVNRAQLKEGDLVFFRTTKGKKGVPTHVGIYLKNGKFIHASTSKGVVVSSLSEAYYQRTWLGGGRVK